jgi:hypothetical protein
MSVTDQDIQDLIVAMDRGRARWINGGGEISEDAPFRQANDMTIFGPFGGPGPRPGQISPQALAALQAAWPHNSMVAGDRAKSSGRSLKAISSYSC